MKKLYIKNTNKGRGVFCKEPIKSGEIIEVAPVIVLPKSDSVWEHNNSILDDYYYAWKVSGKEAAALALGMGSLYNHSYTPNAEYAPNYSKEEIRFVAIKNIPANEEITVNYNGDAKDKSPVWFKVK